MAFTLEDNVLQYQENCYSMDEATLCQHFLLEELAVPEEEVVCARCKTNWHQRLVDMVERSVGDYTTAYPCMTSDNQAHVVPQAYKLCPHCKTPIIHLTKELATSLVGSDVPEVKPDPTARDPIDFDPRLFVSSTATAYPQLYRDMLQVWMEKTQASDLSGEVISLKNPHLSLTWGLCKKQIKIPQRKIF